MVLEEGGGGYFPGIGMIAGIVIVALIFEVGDGFFSSPEPKTERISDSQCSAPRYSSSSPKSLTT